MMKQRRGLQQAALLSMLKLKKSHLLNHGGLDQGQAIKHQAYGLEFYVGLS